MPTALDDQPPEGGLIANKDKFLLVKGAAGLGNRILCALTGILYARICKRRLIIDWSDQVYSDDGSNVFPKFFHCRCSESTDNIPITNSVRPPVWRGHLHDSAQQVRRRSLPGTHWNPGRWGTVSIDLRRLDYSETVLVMWFFTEEVDKLRRHFRGKTAELRKASTKDILKKLMRENLILHPSIRERVDRFKREKFDHQMVGVHIRYTDKRSRLALIRNKLDALLQRDANVTIFLATDNLEIQKLFQESYSGVITTAKWYPRPGMRVHRSPECLNRTENGIEALIDMYLLAECNYLVLDESSAFSYVASLVTDRANSTIWNVQHGWWLQPRLRRFLWLLTIRMRRLVSK